MNAAGRDDLVALLQQTDGVVPQIVQKSGISVVKSTRNFLLIIGLVSEDGSLDRNGLRPSRYTITRWTEMPKGGHFAAMEQPQLLVDDVRAFYRTFYVPSNATVVIAGSPSGTAAMARSMGSSMSDTER